MSYESVKALLARGVSRPTLFQVTVNFGGLGNGRQANDQLEFLCKTTAVPETSAATIAVNGKCPDFSLPCSN